VEQFQSMTLLLQVQIL